MQIEEIETGRLSTNEHNPRQVRGSRFDKLVKSLKKDPDFLKARPILYKKVDNENIVFAGNQRLLACKKLNMKTVYAIDCSMLSDEQIKRLTVLDNTHAGEWDFDMLSSFYDTHDLLELGLTEFDLKIYDTPIEFKDTAETGYQFDQRKQIEEEANRIAKEKYEAEKQKIERETKEKVLSDIKLGKQEITIDMLPKETKQALIEELKEEVDKKEENIKYTKKVESPIYTPNSTKPDENELVDIVKYNQLLNEIDNSNLNDKEKLFLKLSATRHLIFNYEKIADYYASSNKEVQKIMENHALIIIDFNRAIELGYVKLKEDIERLYREEYA